MHYAKNILILLNVNVTSAKTTFCSSEYPHLALGIVYSKQSVKELLNCQPPSYDLCLLSIYTFVGKKWTQITQ